MKLKPCPFCGEVNKLSVWSCQNDNLLESLINVENYIMCESCSALGPRKLCEDIKEKIKEARKFAIDLWNKRIPI